MLFYWQREIIQSIKCKGANNCGTRGFLMRVFRVIFFYNPVYSLPGVPIIVEGVVYT